MEIPPPLGQPPTPRSAQLKRRLKVANACQSCRAKKIKCDGVVPDCGNCQKRSNLRGTCTYTRGQGLSVAVDRINRTPRPLASSAALPQPSAHLRTPSAVSTASGQTGRSGAADNIHYDGHIASFAGEVSSAIDARLGPPFGNQLNLMPMLNAPLFGAVARRKPADANAHGPDRLLPPRKQADHLVALYWKHIGPIEPLLDREGFFQAYRALFAGDPLPIDESTFLCSLNLVFAFAAQLEEHLPSAERDGASNAYFGRAWSLLPPESVVWEPGSYQTVQCLMLMSRYLQCTNSPHQTWMAMGSAVCLAQSIGLHVPDAPDDAEPCGDDWCQRRQTWQCCVFFHRVISWSLGRTPVSSPIIAAEFLNDEEGMDDAESCQAYLIKSLQIYEINNYIVLSQSATRAAFADKVGLPALYQHEDYCSLAMKLDVCLNKWYNLLPWHMKLKSLPANVTDVVYQRAVVTYFRYLHGKISIFRPMVARLCLSSPPQAAVGYVPHSRAGIKDRVLKESASFCVEHAQEMIDVVYEMQKPKAAGARAGALPWWHRVFYLHTATTVLIAAMLRADLFSDIVSPSWPRTLEALHAHEHLTPFFQQCVAAFETLYSKIAEMQNANANANADGVVAAAEEGPSNAHLDGFFQDFGMEKDNFLFGFEDATWLANFTNEL